MKKGLRSVLFSVLVGALLLCAGCGKSGDIYNSGRLYGFRCMNSLPCAKEYRESSRQGYVRLV